MAANVLVVASQTAGSQHLLEALKHRAERGPIRITLVMPAQGPGLGGREANPGDTVSVGENGVTADVVELPFRRAAPAA